MCVPPQGRWAVLGILNLQSSHPSAQRLRNILAHGLKGPPSPKTPLAEGCQAALVASLPLLLSLEPPPSCPQAPQVPSLCPLPSTSRAPPSKPHRAFRTDPSAGFAEKAEHAGATAGDDVPAVPECRGRVEVMLPHPPTCLSPSLLSSVSFFVSPSRSSCSLISC